MHISILQAGFTERFPKTNSNDLGTEILQINLKNKKFVNLQKDGMPN